MLTTFLLKFSNINIVTVLASTIVPKNNLFTCLIIIFLSSQIRYLFNFFWLLLRVGTSVTTYLHYCASGIHIYAVFIPTVSVPTLLCPLYLLSAC